MDARVYELLNDQINKELYSSYLYLSFADYYEEEGLEGFANWYEIQAKEERDHALIFRNYLHENGCKVKLLAIDQPDKEFTTFLEPLEAALEHEKYVTSLINDIYAAAAEVKDHEVPRLVHRGAAGGRGQRRQDDHAHEAVRLRCEGPVRPRSGERRARVLRAVPAGCCGIGRKRLRAIAPPPMRGRFFVYSEPRYCQKRRADDESGAPLRFMP